ncbi:MAG TPA: hypothetical protein DEH02_15460 [Bacteroidales bacterium]|nr:MAG: hypothetical protein A2X01_08560 [Bacteroidetes bacterium GWF2_35_48]HBX52461.1 hypothetical protein [Bacteroidales bacterium]
MKTIFTFIFLAALMSSCITQNSILNIEKHYTTVEKILKVSPGFTMDEVNNTLGIKPYDVLYSNQDSYLIAIYYYKHLFRTVSNEDVAKNLTEPHLTSGDMVFGEPSSVYVIFDKSKKVTAYYTDLGNKSGITQTIIHEYLKKLPANFDINKFDFIGKTVEKDTLK